MEGATTKMTIRQMTIIKFEMQNIKHEKKH